MRIRLGCEMRYAFPYPVPMVVMLNVHPSRAGAWKPRYAAHRATGSGGDLPRRVRQPVRPPDRAGRQLHPRHRRGDQRRRRARSGHPDAEQHPSRRFRPTRSSSCCRAGTANRICWPTRPGACSAISRRAGSRVQAVCDFVHAHIAFGYEFAHRDRTAMDAYAGGRGVCRDFTHLAVAFCRALNVPTRYCTGYISFIGEPEPHPAGDFAAWMEVYLGGQLARVRPAQQQPADRPGDGGLRARRRGRAADPHLRAQSPGRFPGLGRPVDHLDGSGSGEAAILPEEPLPPQSMATRTG